MSEFKNGMFTGAGLVLGMCLASIALNIAVIVLNNANASTETSEQK